MEEVRAYPISNGRETFVEAGEAVKVVGFDRRVCQNRVSSTLN